MLIPRAKLQKHAKHGRGRENSMHRYFKIMLKAATAVALVSSAAVLTAPKASAQFGFEGMIRGAMGGGFSRRHHGRVHESRHHRRHSKGDDVDDDDSKDSAKDASKDKDSKSAGNDSKADLKPASAAKQVDAAPNEGQPQAAASGAPTSSSKPSDMPAFTPSR